MMMIFFPARTSGRWIDTTACDQVQPVSDPSDLLGPGPAQSMPTAQTKARALRGLHELFKSQNKPVPVGPVLIAMRQVNDIEDCLDRQQELHLPGFEDATLRIFTRRKLTPQTETPAVDQQRSRPRISRGAGSRARKLAKR